MNAVMEKQFNNQAVKYIVQSQMFCKLDKCTILDCRTATIVEVYRDDKLVQSFAVAPPSKDKLPGGEKKLNEMGLTVKYLNWIK